MYIRGLNAQTTGPKYRLAHLTNSHIKLTYIKELDILSGKITDFLKMFWKRKCFCFVFVACTFCRINKHFSDIKFQVQNFFSQKTRGSLFHSACFEVSPNRKAALITCCSMGGRTFIRSLFLLNQDTVKNLNFYLNNISFFPLPSLFNQDTIFLSKWKCSPHYLRFYGIYGFGYPRVENKCKQLER